MKLEIIFLIESLLDQMKVFYAIGAITGKNVQQNQHQIHIYKIYEVK